MHLLCLELPQYFIRICESINLVCNTIAIGGYGMSVNPVQLVFSSGCLLRFCRQTRHGILKALGAIMRNIELATPKEREYLCRILRNHFTSNKQRDSTSLSGRPSYFLRFEVYPEKFIHCRYPIVSQSIFE